RVIDPSYLGDQPNLRPTFAAIGFDCLLDINEKIFPVFVLQFYKSVRLIRSLNGTLSITFIIQNVEITLRLEEFSRILHIPCRGVCVFTFEWAISSLPNGVYSNPDIYPPPHEDPLLIRDALFYPRPHGKTRKVKGIDVTIDPFQMVISELKTNLKKWEIILSENAVSLKENKDHPNACLCYMIYWLTIGKHFILAYYIAKRMVSVTKSADMTLPYGMLLTRLFEHVRVAHPHEFSDDLYLVDQVMIPLSEKRVFMNMSSGKRPRLPTPTPSESSDSTSSSSHQEEENDPEGVTPSVVDMMVETEKQNSLEDTTVLGSFPPLSTPGTTTVGNAPGKSSYANVTGKSSGKKLNFRTLFTPRGKYGLVHSMFSSSTGLFSFQFSSMDGLDAMLKNGPWFIRNNPLILKKWHPNENLMKEDIGMDMSNITSIQSKKRTRERMSDQEAKDLKPKPENHASAFISHLQ
ncbi:hypothetical protein Tco_0215954, partial [Tanacetum coccineum]